MDFWRETVVVAPDGGMCEATTPGVYGWPTLPQFDHGYTLLNTQRVA